MKLTPALARMLALVEATPGTTSAELADHLSMTRQGVSKLVGALVNARYVDQQFGEDRRARRLTLTATGRTALLATARPGSTDAGSTPGRNI